MQGTSSLSLASTQKYQTSFTYSHIALQKAVDVEGMGGVWDRSADARRHPHFETGVLEAVVAWNAPQPYHPEADVFIARSLDHAFPDGWRHA